MRPLNESTSRVTGKTFSRKFVALGRIINNWPDIVGAKFAGKAVPVKIHYRKAKKKGEPPQAKLDIAVSSADATLLHYQKDVILQRINQIFGDSWINDIRFVTQASNQHTKMTPSSPRPLTARPLTQNDHHFVQISVRDINDEELNKSLESLGLSILSDTKGT